MHLELLYSSFKIDFITCTRYAIENTVWLMTKFTDTQDALLHFHFTPELSNE